jgi:hypothetical protein
MNMQRMKEIEKTFQKNKEVEARPARKCSVMAAEPFKMKRFAKAESVLSKAVRKAYSVKRR